jgi:hypothetical protein
MPLVNGYWIFRVTELQRDLYRRVLSTRPLLRDKLWRGDKTAQADSPKDPDRRMEPPGIFRVTPKQFLEIHLEHGYKAASRGHGEVYAADIDAQLLLNEYASDCTQRFYRL